MYQRSARVKAPGRAAGAECGRNLERGRTPYRHPCTCATRYFARNRALTGFADLAARRGGDDIQNLIRTAGAKIATVHAAKPRVTGAFQDLHFLCRAL